MGKPKDSASKETNALLEAKREELLDAEAKDSPVLSLISKRLRAARKKVKKVEEIEAIKASGREINTDQVCCNALHAATCHTLRPLISITSRRSTTTAVALTISITKHSHTHMHIQS